MKTPLRYGRVHTLSRLAPLCGLGWVIIRPAIKLHTPGCLEYRPTLCVCEHDCRIDAQSHSKVKPLQQQLAKDSLDSARFPWHCQNLPCDGSQSGTESVRNPGIMRSPFYYTHTRVTQCFTPVHVIKLECFLFLGKCIHVSPYQT